VLKYSDTMIPINPSLDVGSVGAVETASCFFNQGRTDELMEAPAALDSERHSYPISLSPLDRIGSGGGLMGSGACTYDIGAEQR